MWTEGYMLTSNWVQKLSSRTGEWCCVLSTRLIPQDVEYNSRHEALTTVRIFHGLPVVHYNGSG